MEKSRQATGLTQRRVHIHARKRIPVRERENICDMYFAFHCFSCVFQDLCWNHDWHFIKSLPILSFVKLPAVHFLNSIFFVFCGKCKSERAAASTFPDSLFNNVPLIQQQSDIFARGLNLPTAWRLLHGSPQPPLIGH